MHTNYPPFDEMLERIRFLFGLDRDEDELWTLFSYVDNYAKYLSTLDEHDRMIEDLFAVCREHGYIPQYNVSGPAVFIPNGTLLNDNAKFMITPDRGGIMISTAGEMRPIVFLFCEGGENGLVFMSPNTDRMVIVVHDGETSHIILWNLTTLKTVKALKTLVRDISWGREDTFYYIDSDWHLRKITSTDDLDSRVCDLADNVSKFCVNEPLGLALSICPEATFLDDIEANTYHEFEEVFSPDSIITPEEDGFRVFSDSKLYSVTDRIELIFTLDKCCRTRESNDQDYRVYSERLFRDSEGYYIQMGRYKYYFDENGEIAWVKTNPAYQGSMDHALNSGFRHYGYEGDAVRSSECPSPKEILEMFREDGALAFVNLRGEICVAKMVDEIRKKYVKADVVIFKGLPNFLLRSGSILNPEYIDIDSIDFGKGEDYSSQLPLMPFYAHVRIKESKDLSPLGELLLEINNPKMYKEISDETHRTRCTYLADVGKMVVITDGDECKFLDNNLDPSLWYKFDGPIIWLDGKLSIVRPNGRIDELKLEGVPSDIQCIGNGTLWSIGGRSFMNGQDITETIRGISGSVHLISERTLVIIGYEGWYSYRQGEPEAKAHHYKDVCFWNILGLSDRHFLSMCHYTMDGDMLTVRFAELNVKNGSWKGIDGTLSFRVPTYNSSREHTVVGNIFSYIDFRKQRIIQIERVDMKSNINRFDLSKGEIVRSSNALRSNITKKWLRPKGLGGGTYAIMTTEEDESEGSTNAFRTEVRLMDSMKGTTVKGKGKSKDIMYGAPGYSVSDSVCRILISPEKKHLFIHYSSDTAIQSFDLITRQTYPEDGPVRGIIMGFETPGKVIVALPDDNHHYRLRREYDYHMNPLSEPIPMVAEVYPEMRDIRFSLPTDVTGDGFVALEPNHLRMSRRLCTIMQYDIDADAIPGMKLSLGHFNDGLLENVREWTVSNPLPERLDEYSSTDSFLQHTIFAASSAELLAVFDASSFPMDDIESPVKVTLFYGNSSKILEARNPFDGGRAHECSLCPVWVSGNRYAYSRDVGDKSLVELHEISADGKDNLLKSMKLKGYLIPVYADESMLIVYNTDDGKIRYSSNWKTTHKTEGDMRGVWHGPLDLLSCEGGVYEFADAYNEYTFSNGMFKTKDRVLDKQELKLENGTLKWRYGVVILKI